MNIFILVESIVKNKQKNSNGVANLRENQSKIMVDESCSPNENERKKAIVIVFNFYYYFKIFISKRLFFIRIIFLSFIFSYSYFFFLQHSQLLFLLFLFPLTTGMRSLRFAWESVGNRSIIRSLAPLGFYSL